MSWLKRNSHFSRNILGATSFTTGEPAMLTATVGYDGSAQATITAITDPNGGGVKFAISLVGSGAQLVGDLRGLFLDLKENILSAGTDEESPFNWFNNSLVTGTDVTEVQWGEDSVVDLGSGANMQGETPSNLPPEGYPGDNIFDLGIEIGTPGEGQDYVQSTEFVVDGITLDDLEDQFFGLRLTSTTGTSKSLKLVGKFTDGDTTDDWEGLSPGYWRNWSPEPLGNQVNDWNQDAIIYGEGQYKSFETVFQVDPGDWLISPTQGQAGDVSLLQALQLGADLKPGLKRNVLARQATAALLNTLETDENDPNGSVNYRFSTGDVLKWTKESLTADYGLVASQVEAVAPDVDTATWTDQQSIIFGLANMFAANNNLGLYG